MLAADISTDTAPPAGGAIDAARFDRGSLGLEIMRNPDHPVAHAHGALVEPSSRGLTLQALVKHELGERTPYPFRARGFGVDADSDDAHALAP